MVIAKHVLYSGRVQGVGFRYTTLRLAKGLAVGGFVRNLPNGQVELLAEGEESQVDELLRRITHAMAGNVSDAAVTDVSPEGHSGFQIRR